MTKPSSQPGVAAPAEWDKVLRPAIVIWGAMVAAACLFLVLAFVTHPSPKPPFPPTMTTLAGGALVALLEAVLSVVMPARITRTSIATTRLSFRDPPLGGTASDRVLDKVDEVMPRLVGCAGRGLQTGYVFAVSVVLMGAVMRVCGLDPLWATPFFAVSLALLMSQYPSRARFIALIEKATDAKWPAGP